MKVSRKYAISTLILSRARRARRPHRCQFAKTLPNWGAKYIITARNCIVACPRVAWTRNNSFSCRIDVFLTPLLPQFCKSRNGWAAGPRLACQSKTRSVWHHFPRRFAVGLSPAMTFRQPEKLVDSPPFPPSFCRGFEPGDDLSATRKIGRFFTISPVVLPWV